MSVFAVWGMTYAHAFGMAQKKTRTIETNGTIIPEPEWLKRCHEAAEAIMDGEMIRQLSTKFDAPHTVRRGIHRHSPAHAAASGSADPRLETAAGRCRQADLRQEQQEAPHGVVNL